jgi:DNA mismatch repair protein MutS
MADSLARLDVLCAFAERSQVLRFSCPTFSGERGINITAGRHPVVESLQDQPFTPNDLLLNDERRMAIITGPNMGGKSTYMRQTALIVILAHAGSWVPAAGRDWPHRRDFHRIGAGDDLPAEDPRSWWMSETANILNKCQL